MTDLHALAARWRHSARYPAEPANEWQRGEREALVRCADDLDAALREPPEPTAEEVERAAGEMAENVWLGQDVPWRLDLEEARPLARAALRAARSRP